jgi:arylsulfatase A-like enzyme
MKQEETTRRAFGFAARLLFAFFLLFTSFYAVLAYFPETYIAFVQAPFLTWVPMLIRVHPYIYTALTAAVGLSLWMERDDDRTSRRMALEFIGAALLVSIYLFLARPFSGLRNDSHSLVLGLAALFPILWVGAMDCRTYWRKRDWSMEAAPYFSISLLSLAAVTISIIYPSAAHLRYRLGGMPLPPLHGVDLLAWAGSVVAHVLFFAFIVGLLAFCESLAWRTRQRLKTRFALFTAVACIAIAVVFERVAFGAIPFHGTESMFYSAWFGLACALFGGGLALRFASGPAVQRRSNPRPRLVESALLATVLIVAASVVPAIIGVIDWNSVLERTWVLTFWAATLFSLLWIMPRPKRPLQPIAAILLPVVAYGAYMFCFQSHVWASPKSSFSDAVSIHSSYDVSYTLVRDLLATEHKFPCDEDCRYFHEQTNIPPAMPPLAPELDLVDNLTPATGQRPNIFVFVVDSLRQDFVTAYNSAVDNTPEIAAFAKDSLVFRNAFSRYAGTTLSEPAIWAGAMLLHTHYVQPFSRVNNLEKLAAIDGYQSFVTVDSTLRVLLDREHDVVRLDEQAAQWTDIDLCSTINDTEAKILRRTEPARPIFLFSQPQNVHLITVYKRHAEIIHTKEAIIHAYAEELRRMDGCFGGFIRFLKSNRLYENSIIVLTADHGEFGHDSHATSVEPDIMRVPLIMHVPKKIRDSYYYDTAKLIFTTDITPTLYYLLGHRPIRNDEVLGRPMITQSREESLPYERPSYLLASSYAPNYGMIDSQGRTFFSFDDAKHTQSLYALASDPHGDRNLLTTQAARQEDRAIRSHIAQISRAYNFHYQPATFLGWLMH